MLQDIDLKYSGGILTTGKSLAVGGSLAVTGPALGVPQPTDSGYLAWTFDPMAIGGGTNLVSQTVYLSKLVVHRTITVSTMWFGVTGTAPTLTAGQNFIGIVSFAGSRVTVGGFDSVTQGANSVSVTGATLTPGAYWASVVATVASGSFSIAVGEANANVRALVNGPLTAANYRAAINGTGQTSLPSSITPSSNSTSTIPFWSGVS